MRRRSFFGMVFGGLVARSVPRAARSHDYWEKGLRKLARFKPPEPVEAHGTLEGQNGGTTDTYQGQPRAFVSYPVSGRTYQPGESFSIGRRQVITKVN